MKKLFIILISAFFGLQLNAQVSSAPFVVTAATKMNVVYAGIENPLSIAISDILPENLYLTANKGCLKGTNGKYLLWIPFQEKGSVDIAIYHFKDGKMDKIDTRTFRIKSVPKPVAYFGSKESGDITKEEIKSVEFITTRLEDFEFEGIKFTVKKYKFVYVPKKGNALFFETNKSALSDQMKECLSKATKGALIIVTDIFVAFPGSEDFKLPGNLVLTVTDYKK